MNTQIRMKCNKISTEHHWQPNADGSKKLQATIELGVAYTNDEKDPNYPYAQLSGGTVFPLHTINQEVIAGFEIGKSYMVTITEIE